MSILLEFRPELRYMYAIISFITLIFLIITYQVYASSLIGPDVLFPTILAYPFLAFSYIIYIKLKAATTIYQVTERELIENKGIIFKNSRIIPIINLDNIVTRRGFVNTLFGTCSVHIDSPGGPGFEITMNHIRMDNIHRLQEILSERIENLQRSKPEGKMLR
ncbi:PH domain-containing protein, partial [Candidatus Micrarchaeota archaeon]|nr:PH domain-containing protein [Candidatus Micrarchaeota archaeon]